MSALDDPPVATVLARLHAEAAELDAAAAARVAEQERALGRRLSAAERDAVQGDGPPLAVSAATGRLLHVLALSRPAPRIVEFGSSHGISTIYLAAAARDAGGRSSPSTPASPSPSARAELA